MPIKERNSTQNGNRAIAIFATFTRSFLLLLPAALIAGCSPVVTKPAPVAAVIAQSRVTNPSYRIGVGDEVETRFFFAPELDDVQQVRPDGKISLMFLQDVQAAGRTPAGLAATIKKKLKAHVKEPDLVVVVRAFGSLRAFVGGEVVKPGTVPLQGGETLLQVLDEAGWILPTARREEIELVRRGEDGEEDVYPININPMMSGEDLSQNVEIHGGDLILVPPSDAASVDRWVDRNIRQTLPFSSAFIVNRGVGP